jgi:hypothetical protein
MNRVTVLILAVCLTSLGLLLAVGLSGGALAWALSDDPPPGVVAAVGLLLFTSVGAGVAYWVRIHRARRAGQRVTARAVRSVRLAAAQASFLPLIICIPSLATARGAAFQDWGPVLAVLAVAGMLPLLAVWRLTRGVAV